MCIDSYHIVLVLHWHGTERAFLLSLLFTTDCAGMYLAFVVLSFFPNQLCFTRVKIFSFFLKESAFCDALFWCVHILLFSFVLLTGLFY